MVRYDTWQELLYLIQHKYNTYCVLRLRGVCTGNRNPTLYKKTNSKEIPTFSIGNQSASDPKYILVKYYFLKDRVGTKFQYRMCTDPGTRGKYPHKTCIRTHESTRRTNTDAGMNCCRLMLLFIPVISYTINIVQTCLKHTDSTTKCQLKTLSVQWRKVRRTKFNNLLKSSNS